MEVHHHSHTARKKWRHYFWEFLMLFLAVFCGFLAENQREHYVENQRAKAYAKTLVEDLANDTLELQDVTKEYNIILACFDSINANIRRGIKSNTVPGSFYFYCNIGTFSPAVVWHNATLTQITQSGSLRYFKNTELVKKLSIYFANCDFISLVVNGDSRYRDESIKLRNRILNNYFFSRYSAFLIANWEKIPDSMMNIPLLLQSDDPVLLNEFANGLETRRRVLTMLATRNYPQALQRARELIQILKAEYHVK